MAGQVSLSSYTSIKLRLASVLQNLLRFAQEQKDEDRSRSIQELLADLAEDTFRLAVFGKYNRGKSTLMNALLGVDRLPTGILPLTSVITTVRHDTHERVLIQSEGWSLPQEVSLAQLPEYVTENGNPGNQRKVTVAQIFLPAEILRYGFFLIDTPGTGSSILANTKAAESFISRADAAIVVMSVESPLDEEELDLLDRVHREVGKVFVVLNKADLISHKEREQIAEVFTARVRSQINEEVPIFILSARNAMRAIENKADDSPREEGLEKLIEALLAFMATEKTGQFLRRMAERIGDLIEEEQLIQLVLQKTTDKQPVIEGFNDFVHKALSEGIEAIRSLKAAAPASIANSLQSRVAEWQAGLKQDLKADTSQNRRFDLVEYLEIRSALKMNTLVPEFPGTIKKLETLIQSIRDREASLTGGGHPVVKGNAGDQILLKFKDNSLMPAIPVAPFEWKRRHRFFGRWALGWNSQAKRALLHPLEAYCSEIYRQLELGFEKRSEGIVEFFTRELKRRQDRVAQILHQQNDPARSAALKQLSQELEDATRQIGDSKDAAQGTSTSETIRRASRRPIGKRSPKDKCILCQHLTKVTFHFIGQYQYQLLTDPAERIRNAERGGMCPFHTWMYESISSPQGICGGYAPVLLHLADRLDSVVNNLAQMPDQVERAIRNLANSSDHCIVCQVLRSAQAEKLSEITTSSERIERSALCVPHLCTALLNSPQMPRSLSAIGELAVGLRRMGEDMEQFALKQSGLRYGWTSSGERAAYVNGLMTVAGARSLSFVRKIVEIGTG